MLLTAWLKSWKSHRSRSRRRVSCGLHSERTVDVAKPLWNRHVEQLEDRDLMSALAIQFDYSLDTNNFFDSQARRELLDQAASVFEQRFVDDLAAIQPLGGNTWNASFLHPGIGQSLSLSNLSVPADTVIIYAGGRDLGGTLLGLGGAGQVSAVGNSAWQELVETRGQPGVLAETPTDFGPWGGVVTFTTNSATTWHFGSSTAGLDAGESDFLTVAVHEIAHVLGFSGGTKSFRALSPGASFLTTGSFAGPKSMAEYDAGGNVPLSGASEFGTDNSHWASDVTDGGAFPVMGSASPRGTRRFFTELDYAGMDDLGWTLTNTTLAISVSPTSGLATTEAGGTNTFSVALTRQPTNDVTISLSSSNSSEGQVSTSQMTFTPANWFVPQTVTVSGMDDSTADGDQTFTIVTAPAVSDDIRFNGLNAADVTIVNRDNESPLGANSAPTDITRTSSTVVENRPVGTTVGTLSAVDSDAGDTISFALVAGTGSTDNAAFRIAGNTLTTGMTFDFEEKTSYSVRVRATDRLGGNFEKSFAINVTNANEAPAVDLNGRLIAGLDFGATLVAGSPAVSIVEPQSLRVSDIDSSLLSSASITIANLRDGAAESLSATTVAGIAVNYDSATGTLTLTGTASLSDYENVLRSVKYGNSSSSPNTTPRVIQFTVTDTGGAASTVVTSIVGLISAASRPTFVFANGVGGTGLFDEASDVTIDAAGNVIMVGAFNGTVDFDPGPAVTNLTSLDFDIFVAKYSPSGNLIWAKSVGGPFSDGGQSVDVDSFGNVYFTGSLFGAIDFDPGSGTTKLTSNGANDVFLAKWSTDGEFLWAKSFGGRQSESVEGLDVDASGNAYVAGSFLGTVDFDPGSGTTNLISAGDRDAYIAKFNASGELVWAKRVGGSGHDNSSDVTVDSSGRVVIGGFFTGSVDFDPGAGTTTLSSGKGFLLQLNEAGVFVWARSVNASIRGVALDGSGHALAVGGFSGTVDFDPGNGATSLTAVGSGDVFVWKLDPSGQFVWARQLGGSDFETSTGIAVDSGGSVYTTGSFSPTADFDPGPGVFSLTSLGGEEVFISKLTSGGDFAWAVSLGGEDSNRSNSIAVDATGNVVTVGYFGRGASGSATGDFDPGTGTFVLTSVAGSDAFVSKLKQTANQAPTDVMLTRTRVAKSATIGTPVGSFVTTDAGDGNNFTYALASGTGSEDNTAFTIVGGELRSAASFSAVTKSQFNIRVRATDYSGLSVEKALVVMLSTVNEEPLDITLSSNRIAENAAVGTAVGTLTTTDFVAGDTFTYSLVSGTGSTDNSAFTIVGDQLRTATLFNYDVQRTYHIRVRSTDVGGLFVERPVTIHVSNINALPTLVVNHPVDVFRGTTVTISNADLLASDPDNTADEIIYQISGTSLGTPRGQLELNGQAIGFLDTFTQDDINQSRLAYRHFGGNNFGDHVSFRVLDGAGGTASGGGLSLAILASQRPVIDLNGATAGVDYSATFTPGGGPIAIVDVAGLTVTDSDTTTLASATIWLNNGLNVNSETFAVDTSGTTLIANFTQFEDGRARLDVTGTASLAAYQKVLRTLTYENTATNPDRQPRKITFVVNDGGTSSKEVASTVLFPNRAPTSLSLSRTSVAENVTVGSLVGAFTTSDPDIGNTFTYSLVSGSGSADNAAFTIAGDELFSNSTFDFESKSSYSIRIRTTDQGGLSFEQSLTIAVSDVSDTPIVSIVALPNGYVLENRPIGTLVDYFGTASSNAHETFMYSLVSGNGDADNAAFTIDGRKLLTNAVFDFEAKNTSSIRVRSTDSDGEFIEKAFTIHVMNLNETLSAIEDQVSAITEVHPDVIPPDSAGAASIGKPGISADNRYVVFASGASNLVPGDTNGQLDVFLRDLQAGTTIRISRGIGGVEANGSSFGPSISSDGRFVAFTSNASNLVVGDLNNSEDVFVHDLVNGTTVLVNVRDDDDRVLANGRSALGAISADGQQIVFVSSATNLSDDGRGGLFVRDLQAGTTTRVLHFSTTFPNFQQISVSGDGLRIAFERGGEDRDVFVFDRALGTVSLVSVAADGSGGNGPSGEPMISSDSRYVVFWSDADNLIAGGTNSSSGIFLRDLLTQTTSRMVASRGDSPSISADGRFVAFREFPLVSLPVGVHVRYVLHDRQLGTTTSTTVSSAGDLANADDRSIPVVSADGRLVVFTHRASNLALRDTNNQSDVFVRDVRTGTTGLVSRRDPSLASITAHGRIGDSGLASLSADGKTVVFSTAAKDVAPGLAPPNPNGSADYSVFLRDLSGVGETAFLVGDTEQPWISASGRYAVFFSYAEDLVPNDTNGDRDLFVLDRQTSQVARVNVSNTEVQANGDSWDYIKSSPISANGRFVVFVSDATNLVAGDTNGQRDIFVRDLELGTTTRVSVSNTGAQANQQSYSPSISADGRFVVFTSDASNLVPGDTNGVADIFVRDLLNKTTMRVNVSSSGVQANQSSESPVINANGRYVAFASSATNLASSRRGAQSIYLRDLLRGTTTLVSAGLDESNTLSSSSSPSISDDGRFVAFGSDGNNLVPDDTNQGQDVFVRDMARGVTVRLSLSANGQQADAGSNTPVISGDGTRVVFRSSAGNLVPNDFNADEDWFVVTNVVELLPSVSISVSPSQVLEDGPTPLLFTLTRDGSTDSPLTVAFSVSGTASFSSDYQQTGAASFAATSGTLTFSAGASTATLTLDPTTDSVFEPDESVRLTLTSDLDYRLNESASAQATITNDDHYGFRIVESDGRTAVTESGSTDTFTVVLTAQPNSNVVLSLVSSDTGEATVSPATLTFSRTNWNVPQKVTVKGINDDFVDGSQTSNITIRVNAASSENRFDAFPAQTVMVTTTDNDVAGFRVTESGGSTSVNESGTTDTFTVVLTARPVSNVVLNVSSGNTAESTVSPATATFTTSNWSVPQTVTVRGVNDDAIDGNQTSLITVRVNDASSHNSFDELADQTVTVTTVDNDLSDFGDAPDSYGTSLPNGARHLVSTTGPKLGSRWDGETNGQPSVDASADGTDEDGVLFPVDLLRQTNQAVASSVFVTASKAAKLDAWIDFNRDGDFLDVGERIATGKAVTAGLNLITFSVPTSATSGDTFARFRISTSGVSGPTGSAPDGEVEDYAVKILDGESSRRLTVDLPAGSPAITVALVSNNLEVKAGTTLMTRVSKDRVTSLEINGSSRNDKITLGAMPSALSGQITLNGGAGDDSLNGTSAGVKLRLVGDSDDDTLLGGSADDTLLGDSGDDSLDGNGGDDILRGGSGKDKLFGDAGNDALVGDDGDDSLEGSSGRDTLLGLAGNDTLKGGDDNDTVMGGANDDSINGGNGTDILTGDGGNDRFDVSGERNELFSFDIHQILDRI